jgi:MFS transporter, DHA1 family, multidrug resistance protein
MMTNLANARLVRRFGSDQLMRVGTWVAGLGGLVAWLNVAMGWGGLVGLVLPLLVYMWAMGLVVSNSIAGGLNAFPEKAGAVSALIGGVHYGSGIFGSALVGLWADGTPVPLGQVMALCGVGCVLCTAWLVPRLAAGLSARD